VECHNLALGVIQLGAWRLQERRAVRVIASASLLFAAGVAVQAMTQSPASTDAFHQAGVVLGPVILPNVGINALVTAIYAILLLRKRQGARPEATAVVETAPRAGPRRAAEAKA